MMRITLFGQMRIEGLPNEGGVTPGLGGPKPRHLFQMLALRLGAAVPKDELAERLWDGAPPASYVTTIESYLCVLRGSLARMGAERSVLATTSSGYRLDPEQVSVDVVETRSLLSSARPADVAMAMEQAAPGLLADEPYAAWANQEREVFAALLADACTDAARAAIKSHEDALALRLARTAVNLTYASEPAVQALMRALWRLEARHEALDVYAALRRTLLEEFGLEPAVRTRRLYLAILRSGTIYGDEHADERELRALLQLLRQTVHECTTGGGPRVSQLMEVSRQLLDIAV